MNEPAKFTNGDAVQRVNASNEIGIVLRASWNAQIEGWMYQVRFGADIRGIPEESLRPLVTIVSPSEELQTGSVAGAQHFRHALTYHRVSRPPSRIAKSFSSARTRFYPHQFKPLLKFLDNPEKRILIGDDVGLGKTIEAGYILCELQAQQPLDHVLVLVPARLLTKWRNELRNRFGEHFEIVRSAEVQAYLRRAPGEMSSFRWIVSYETMRGFVEPLKNSPVNFDLVIMDEAHRARTSATKQQELARLVCQRADAVVMLSATPVQNRLEDLWHLLRMLAPSEFSDFSIFQQQMDDNAGLLDAIRTLGGSLQDPTIFAEVRRLLNVYLRSSTGRRLAKGNSAIAALQMLAKDALSRRERIELQAVLSSLSPISHVFTRSRKIDAIPSSAQREASWVSIQLTEIEREIYGRIEDLCRSRASLFQSEWAQQRSLIMVYRALASCIPAAMAHFASGLIDASAFEEAESDENAPESTLGVDVRKALLAAKAHFDNLGTTDTKFRRLLEELGDLWKQDEEQGRAPRKVVLFSYFRRTLEYLRRRLADHTIECRMIHGGIAPDDREGPIEDFLTRPDVRILLTSDVGGEGIDLQRASVLFNYDLPWNPMVVEQRIGRIDRIGQEAQVLVIRNFVVKDSIEERILKRLFERIKVFEQSIGDIDPILGDGTSVESLTEQALFGTFTSEKLEEMIRRDEDALARQHVHARRLEERVDDLIAADQALLDEIDAVTGEHQIPSEMQLLAFINDALVRTGTGCVVPDDAAEKVVRVDLRAALIEGKVISTASDGERTARFLQAAKTAPDVALTVSRDAAYRHAGAELVHATHPLARWALSQLDVPRKAFRLALQDSAVLPPGEYAFAIEMIDIQGSLRAARMMGAVVRCDGQGDPITDSEKVARVLGEILQYGEDAPLPPEVLANVDAICNHLQAAMDILVADWEEREQEVHYARDERRKATILATHELAYGRAEERLEMLRTGKAADFAIRMAEAKINKAREKVEQIRNATPKEPWPGLEREEVGVGLLHVRAARRA